MMAFTLILTLLALFALLVIFVVVYKWKGLKTAIIATGSAFLVFAGMMALAIVVIVNSMGN